MEGKRYSLEEQLSIVNHVSYSSSWRNVYIREMSMIYAFCEDSCSLDIDTDVSLKLLGCSVVMLDTGLRETKQFMGYSLATLIFTGLAIGISVSDLCCRLAASGRGNLEDIISTELENINDVDFDNVYRVNYKGETVKDKSDNKKSFKSNFSCKSENFMNIEAGLPVDVLCATLDSFAKTYVKYNKDCGFNVGNIHMIYDTLRYTGCPEYLAKYKLVEILKSDLKMRYVPMFYYESIRTARCDFDSKFGLDYGFLSIDDIIYLCDYSDSVSNKDGWHVVYRRFFKDAYLHNKYMTSVKKNELPESFSSFLRASITYNKEIVFDKDGKLVRDIPSYELALFGRKSESTRHARGLGFRTVFKAIKGDV